MLRKKLNLRTRKPPRGRALFALAAFACLAALAALALISTRAHAQQPANQNGQRPAQRAKRITPLRTSEGPQGSRVTITSDGELNDYQAYRSGDRFVVIIPQAQGGGGEGAKGRGFEGAQVTRRGNDLVYTFKLAPGASAHVNQRFNRLDVQFNAPAQPANAQATPQPTPRGAIETAGIRQTPTPAPQPTPNTRTNPVSATGQTPAIAPTTGATTGTAATNPNATANPNEVSPSLSATPAQTPAASPSVAPSASPEIASATPEQIAQAQSQPPAPVNVVSQTPAAPASTLGTFIARNIPWIIIAMVGVGVVFLLVARFGDRQPVEPLPPALEESPALKSRAAKDEAVAELEPATHNDEATLVTATTAATTATAATLAAAEPARAKSKKGKRRKEERREARRAAKAEAAAQSAKADAGAAGTTEQIAPVAPATTQPATASTGKSDAVKLAAEAALIDAPLVAGSVAAARAGEKKSEEKKADEKESAAPILPHADTERINEEIRKLLAGGSYDESVVGAGDAATRELVASELSAALASRQPLRNQRARDAFMRHGYFEESARNLQSAEAPAQRASAAHSLSLVRDRAATPHLVAALEDPSPEVRRASVEALAALRDPAALEPLEALRWRETSRQVPRSLIMRAIEASTPAVEEIDLPRERAPEKIDDAPAAEAKHVEAAPTEAPTVEDQTAQLPTAQEPSTETETVKAETAEAETDEAPTDEAPTDEAPTAEESVPELQTIESAAVESSSSAAVESPASSSVAESRASEPSSQPHAAELIGAAALAAESPAAAPVFEEESRSEVAGAAEVAGEASRAQDTGPVYAFDETQAAAWSAPRAEGESADASRRGTGGLDASAPGESEAQNAARESAGSHEPPVYSAPEFAVAGESRAPHAEAESDDWIDLNVEEQHVSETGELARGAAPEAAPANRLFVFEQTPDAGAEAAPTLSTEPGASAGPRASTEQAGAEPVPVEPVSLAESAGPVEDAPHIEKGLEIVTLPHAAHEKGIEVAGADAPPTILPKSIQLRLESEDVGERAASVRALARLSTGEAFQQICAAFDDPSPDVRNAAARALYDVSEDRADTFTRALRESPPERRRVIGASLSTSGLADEAVSQLTGESRERTYDAFSLLFLMAKAGETAPLIRAIESHPDTEVRLAVVKLLALSGQHEVLPSFKRLAVRGSLPNEVRSAVMEAIYQISSAGAQPTRQ